MIDREDITVVWSVGGALVEVSVWVGCTKRNMQ
jgi:hypothetical protein